MTYIGYFEGTIGLSYALGPLMAMLGHNYAAYFCIVAGVTFVIGMILVCALPGRLNNNEPDEELD